VEYSKGWSTARGGGGVEMIFTIFSSTFASTTAINRTTGLNRHRYCWALGFHYKLPFVGTNTETGSVGRQGQTGQEGKATAESEIL